MTESRLFVTALLAAGMCPAATIGSVEPATAITAKGTTVALNVRVNGVSDLYAFEFDIAYDPAVLQFVSIAEGNVFAGRGALFMLGAESTNGLVEFTIGTLLGPESGVTGDFILANIRFKALSEGASAIDLTRLSLLDSTLFGLEAGVQPGAVTVIGQTVPEPASWVCLTLGAFFLLLVRVRPGRRAAASSGAFIRSGAERQTRLVFPK